MLCCRRIQLIAWPASARRAAFALLALSLITASAPYHNASADDANDAPQPFQPGWVEIWAGVDAASHTWLTYSGVTVSPFSNVYEDGLRLRVTGGYGGYVYTGERRSELHTFTARTSYAEALAGYLMRLGPVTAKAFAGIAAIEHRIAPYDPDNPVQGQKVGPKFAAELWINMGASAWGQVDASWTSAHNTSGARARSGYRVWKDVSIGIEGALHANDLGEDLRGGLFTRFAWNGGEFSIAGGYSGRFLEEAKELKDPYATATLLLQF